MAERYERQIGEQGAPSVYGQNYASPESYGFGAAAAIGQLGDQAERTANLLTAYKEKQDNIDLMAATNDFNRQMNAYQFDPDTGQQVTRKLNDARGLLMDTETFADDLKKNVLSKLSKEAAARFEVMETSLRQPFSNSAAKYEAEQREVHAKETANSTIEGFLDSVRSDPFNEEMAATAKDAIAMVLADRMPGSDPDTVNRAIEASASRVEMARILSVATDNPELAERMMIESKDLKPLDRDAIYDKVKDGAKLRRNQRFVEDLVDKYGYDRETEVAVLDKLHQDYEGEDLAQKVSLYKTRVAEKRIADANSHESLAREQKKIMNYLRATYTDNGLPIPQWEREKYRPILDYNHYDTMDDWDLSLVTFSDVMDGVRRDPDFRMASPEEQYLEVQRRMGITPDQALMTYGALRAGIMMGQTTKEEIENRHLGGFIGPTDKENLLNLLAKYGPEQQATINEALRNFNQLLNEFTGVDKLPSDQELIVRNRFLEKLDNVDITKGQENLIKEIKQITGDVLSEMFDGMVSKPSSRMLKWRDAMIKNNGIRQNTDRQLDILTQSHSRILTGMDLKKQSSIKRVLPYVMDVSKATGLLPSVIMAQTFLESEWLARTPRGSNNYHGIKAGEAWRNAGKPWVEATTPEQGPNGLYKTKGKFRVFSSMEESFENYKDVISGKLYASARAAKTWQDQIKELKKAGYASDNAYIDSLSRIIIYNKLYLFDVPDSDVDNKVIPPQRPIEEAFLKSPDQTVRRESSFDITPASPKSPDVYMGIPWRDIGQNSMIGNISAGTGSIIEHNKEMKKKKKEKVTDDFTNKRDWTSSGVL